MSVIEPADVFPRQKSNPFNVPHVVVCRYNLRNSQNVNNDIISDINTVHLRSTTQKI